MILFTYCVNILHPAVACGVGTASANNDDSGAAFFFFFFLSTTTECKALCQSAIELWVTGATIIEPFDLSKAFSCDCSDY